MVIERNRQKSRGRRFMEQTGKLFRLKHSWLSTMSGEARSNFRRTQKLTVLWFAVCTVIWLNAVFMDQQDANAFTSFLQELWIGIVTGMSREGCAHSPLVLK